MPRFGTSRDGPALIRAAAVVLLAFALLTGACAPLAAAPAADYPAELTVRADDRAPQAAIPADFASFSLETCGALVACRGWFPAGRYLTSSNAALLAVFRLVSPACRLRIGGDSSDLLPPPQLDEAAATDLAGFLHGANCRLIYGLDAKAADSQFAAEQARLLSAAVGAGNLAFQIGNEPSLYSPSTLDRTGLGVGFEAYVRLWRSYHDAVAAAVPGSHFMGPDDVKPAKLGDFATAVGAGNLADLTLHTYPLGAGSSANVTVANLLTAASHPPRGLPTPPAATAPSTVGRAASLGMGARITEFNSAFEGGKHGVTDTLASAIWVIDYGMALGGAGWKSAHLHGQLASNPYHPNFYTPFEQSEPGAGVVVRPIFYGMMLLGRMAGGRVLPIAVNGGAAAADLGAYATAGDADGTTKILVLNRSQDRTFALRFDRASGWSAATVLTLAGDGCAATAGVTLGGQAVTPNGQWTGREQPVEHGRPVSLPPCHAALVKLT